MDRDHIIITGAPATPGSAPNRLNINDFVKDDKMFSLYIQALTEMYNGGQDQQSNPLSFFQIGGIHGLPFKPWGDSGSDKPVGNWGGYCAHASTLFPTWHRPYMVLFEQVLQSQAASIAEKYTVDRQAWKDTAAKLRQPFWDWAETIVPPDEVIKLEKVTITTPEGTRTVDNPLFQYRFHPIDDSFTPPFSQWPTTLRHPTTMGPDATSDVKRLISILEANKNDVKSKTYNTLMFLHDWPHFSNTTSHSDPAIAGSLEAVHNQIHNLTGGGGNMASVPMAGFDPIFFLHHANVDRFLALWSALNPDVWVTPGEEGRGTWTIPSGGKVDTNTDLTPFWDSKSTYWQSAESKDVTRFGYSYPEFNGLPNDPDAIRIAIMRFIQEHYGPNFAKRAPLATVNPAEGLRDGIWDWSVRVRVKQYEAESSFGVLIFLGEVPEDPEEWVLSPSYVGSHHAFVNSNAERCENCRRNGNFVTEGFVDLQETIAARSGLGGFDPRVVKPYLRENLKWRVQLASGQPVPLSDVSSLEVLVVAGHLTYTPGTIFSDIDNIEYHYDITEGLEGGARRPE